MDDSKAIAIIGMAGRFPAAANVDELWNLLRTGGNALTTPSDAELRALGVSDETLRNPHYVRARMPFEGADCFDPGFFGYSAKHAQMLDPQQRLFLECAWEALETAGYDSSAYHGSIGVFASCATNFYLLHRAQLADRDEGSWHHADWGDMLFDAEKDHIATRVSFKLNLTGPSVGVQTSCSSSLVAVHLACESLLRGECDVALAGGVSLSQIQHHSGYVYVRDGLRSVDGRCRAFDEEATGLVWGSGLGIVVLKRQADAARDRDSVRALIEGTAINNDGAGKMGYTAPSVQGQQEVMALAQSVAGVTPADIDFIEAHGAGTSLGDSIELTSLVEMFSSSAAGREQSCVLGSVKTNIGHLDVAAGVTGLIKTVLCLEHRAFVPTLHFSRPNPALRVPQCPLSVNTEYRPWPTRLVGPRRAGVTSLGLGGTNAHAIVREAPEVRRPAGHAGGPHLFPLSARGPAALAQMRNRLAAHLHAHPEVDLGDVAFTLQMGRRRFRHRQIILAESRNQLLAALEAPNDPSALDAVCDGTDCAVMLACGAEDVTMGAGVRSLYESDAAYRDDLDAGACAQRFALEYATARLWRRWGVTPSWVVGYQRGRVTARCLAGQLTLDDAVHTFTSAPDAAAPEEAIGLYRSGAAGSGEPTELDWGHVMRETDCVCLQLGPGLVWRDLITSQLGPDNRSLLLPAFVERESDPYRHLLRILARLWLRGVRIDWNHFHERAPRGRVPLPTYPFERASYWLPIPAVPRQAPSPPMASPPASAEPRFFVPGWRVADSSESATAGLTEPGECWLILSDEIVGPRLASWLRDQEGIPVVVTPATGVREDAGHAFSIDPESVADYAWLLRVLRERNLRPRRFVHCWTLTQAEAATAHSVDAFWQQQTLGYFSLLSLAKALASDKDEDTRALTVVTRGTFRVGEQDETCELANATIPGLCKVMAQELPDVHCTVVDLRGGHRDGARASATDEIDISPILTEVTLDVREPVVAYRGGLRLVQMLHKQDLSADRPLIRDLRERGVYVITGGLGKIGLAVARRLAQTCRARLVLLTRNQFPARDVWPSVRDEAGTHVVAATIRALTEIEALGSEVAIYCADVGIELEVEHAFTAAESRFGPVTGVFHLAAAMKHRSGHCPLTDLSRSDVEAQMAPKVGGFYSLARVLERREPDFVALFSSNASILGGFGFGAYAAANAFLDHSVRAGVNDRVQWFCTNWDRWIDDTSNGAAEVETERYVIDMEAGLDALWSILRHSSAPQVIVAAESLSERRERWVTRVGLPSGDRADRASVPTKRRVPPRTELERTIATIWQDVLGCEDIGVDDNFLDLGGDSLIALRILTRLRESFGVEVRLRALLGPQPTVAFMVRELVTALRHAGTRRE